MDLRRWISATWRRVTPVSEGISIAPTSGPRPRVRDGYLPLYTYLEHRYASIVVLTFEQMEALLGFALAGGGAPGAGLVDRHSRARRRRRVDGGEADGDAEPSGPTRQI